MSFSAYMGSCGFFPELVFAYLSGWLVSEKGEIVLKGLQTLNFEQDAWDQLAQLRGLVGVFTFSDIR